MTWECSNHREFKPEELSQDLIDSQNRVHCPECGMIMTNTGGDDQEDIPELNTGGVSEDAPRTNSKRQVELSAEDMHLVKNMVEQGLGEDLNEVARKALRFYGGVRFNETMLGGDTNMINEQLIEQLSQGENESMVEKAMAMNMINGAMGNQNQNQDDGGKGTMERMMEYKMQQDLMNSLGNDSSDSGDDFTIEDMMKYKMMGEMSGGDDSGKELIEVLKAMQSNSDSGNGMSPMAMMMLSQDDGQDDAYKELLQRFDKQRERETQLEQKMIEEKFGNELKEVKGAIQGIKQEVDEAKDQDDLDTALDRLEKIKKQAEKLGMADTGEEPDEARTAQKLIDSVGDNFSGVLEKYFENQGGSGGMGSMMGGQQPQPQTQQSQSAPANPQKVQAAQQQAEQEVEESTSKPSPDEVSPTF